MIPDIEERLRATPPSFFPTQRNSKWYHGDRFVLIGDAAHATVPFYGQGMNSAFESVVELVQRLEEAAPGGREAAFAAYQAARKPHTDAVADLSIQNFDELRSNFRHVVPQARRRLEVMLNRLMPHTYVPLHVKVSHQLVGYRKAIDDCARRDRILGWFGFDLLVYALAGGQLVVSGARRIAGDRRFGGRLFERLARRPAAGIASAGEAFLRRESRRNGPSDASRPPAAGRPRFRIRRTPSMTDASRSAPAAPTGSRPSRS